MACRLSKKQSMRGLQEASADQFTDSAGVPEDSAAAFVRLLFRRPRVAQPVVCRVLAYRMDAHVWKCFPLKFVRLLHGGELVAQTPRRLLPRCPSRRLVDAVRLASVPDCKDPQCSTVLPLCSSLVTSIISSPVRPSAQHQALVLAPSLAVMVLPVFLQVVHGFWYLWTCALRSGS